MAKQGENVPFHWGLGTREWKSLPKNGIDCGQTRSHILLWMRVNSSPERVWEKGFEDLSWRRQKLAKLGYGSPPLPVQ